MQTRKLILFAAALIIGLQTAAIAQTSNTATYTGTLVNFGSGRNTQTVTTTFTLRITGQTSDAEADRLLGVLAEGGQNAVLRALHDTDLGSFSVDGRLGPRLRAVRISEVDGRKRIFAVFDRYIRFEELRWGARSTDYPFGIVEIFVDPKTGKGEGTFIGAAQVRWKKTKGTENDYHVEIENFGTFPGRLMGVVERGR